MGYFSGTVDFKMTKLPISARAIQLSRFPRYARAAAAAAHVQLNVRDEVALELVDVAALAVAQRAHGRVGAQLHGVEVQVAGGSEVGAEVGEGVLEAVGGRGQWVAAGAAGGARAALGRGLGVFFEAGRGPCAFARVDL